PGQFPQFSNRHTFAVARKDLLARCIEAGVPFVLYSLSTARASGLETVGDSALQTGANALRHLGSHSQVVDYVEDATLEPTQLSPIPHHERFQNENTSRRTGYSSWPSSSCCDCSFAFGNHRVRSTKSAYRLRVCLWTCASFDSFVQESILEFNRRRGNFSTKASNRATSIVSSPSFRSQSSR